MLLSQELLKLLVQWARQWRCLVLGETRTLQGEADKELLSPWAESSIVCELGQEADRRGAPWSVHPKHSPLHHVPDCPLSITHLPLTTEPKISADLWECSHFPCLGRAGKGRSRKDMVGVRPSGIARPLDICLPFPYIFICKGHAHTQRNTIQMAAVTCVTTLCNWPASLKLKL